MARSTSHRRSLSMVAVTATVLGTALAMPTGAGAATDQLAEFYAQALQWEQCTDPPPPDPSELPDDGIIVDPWQGQWKEMECAEVTVPVNYAAPGDGRLTVPVSRIRATEPDQRKGVLLMNPGGPGGGGLSMPLGARGQQVAEHFDMIGFDPRGVGRPSRLMCERTPDTRPDTTRPTDDQLAAYTAYARAHEDDCQKAGGGVRPYISTANTARDMDVVRAALGEEKINYLGYSYGTYLGAVYGSLFPEHLNRSVLDSSIHPEWLWREQFLQQSVATRFNVEEWAGWVAERDETYHLGTTADEVLAATEALAAELADRAVPLERERPEDWPAYWPREVDRSRLDSFMALGTQPRAVWDVTAEVIVEVQEAAQSGGPVSGDAGAAIGMMTELEIGKVDAGVYDTVTCEADWPSDLEVYYEDMRRYREHYPYKDFNGSGVVGAAPTNCTFRGFTPPEPLVPLERDGYPAGLVIQADGDPATQYDGGPAMAAQLDNPLISVRDSGEHGHYGFNECVTEQVDSYLIDGVLPPSRSECTAAQRPDVPADDDPDAAADRAPDAQGSSPSKEERVRAVDEQRSVWP